VARVVIIRRYYGRGYLYGRKSNNINAGCGFSGRGRSRINRFRRLGQVVMEGNIVSGLVGAAGAYAAVWAHLGFIKWRLNEQRDLLLEHSKRHRDAEKIIDRLVLKIEGGE